MAIVGNIAKTCHFQNQDHCKAVVYHYLRMVYLMFSRLFILFSSTDTFVVHKRFNLQIES